MSEVVILSAARTAVGAFQGVFRDVSAPQLGARAIAGACERAGLPPAELEQVYMGCVLTAGIYRQAEERILPVGKTHGGEWAAVRCA